MTFIFWGCAAGGATGVSWMLARPFFGQSRWVPSFILVLIPLLTLFVYLVVGSPTQTDAPLSQRLAAPMASLPLNGLIVKVEQRLKETPDDARGWQMLALLRQRQGASDLAILAWQNVMRLRGESADIWLAIAENWIAQNDGGIQGPAREALQRAARLEPDHPMVGYYEGLDLAQQGQAQAARDRWRAVGTGLAADDPLKQAIENSIAQLQAQPEGMTAPH